MDICATLHFVLVNTTGTTGLQNFSTNWEQQLVIINYGDDFGPNISSSPGITTYIQYTSLSEPIATNKYRHYCVTFRCSAVNIIDCPILWFGWRRVPATIGTDYSPSAYITAATICCMPTTEMNCTGSIGYWNNNNGKSRQCYPQYLGDIGGVFPNL